MITLTLQELHTELQIKSNETAQLLISPVQMTSISLGKTYLCKLISSSSIVRILRLQIHIIIQHPQIENEILYESIKNTSFLGYMVAMQF